MKRKLKLSNTLTVVFAGSLLALIGLLQRPCLFYALFCVPCISCGMSRAWLSAFRLDFGGAFAVHPMFWSVPVLLLYVLFDGKLFSRKYANIGALIAIFVGFSIHYLCLLIEYI